MQRLNITEKMTDKYQNKYRISSARLPNWDYGWNAAYFVTICTQNREYFFGDVVNYKMQLSEIGHIAQSCWQEIPKHFPFVLLDAFIIMPNHMHGIVVIDKPDNAIVEMLHATSLLQQRQQPKMQYPKTKKWHPYLQNKVHYQPLYVRTNRR